MTRIIIAAFLLVVAWSPSTAQEPPPKEVTYAIRNVSVVDVARGKLLQSPRTVVLKGDRIVQIGYPGRVILTPAVVTIDGAGLYLMPGLFDAHVHLSYPDLFAPLLLAHGVTFAREMGNATALAVEVRRRLREGELLGPDIAIAGAIVDGPQPIWPMSEACGTPEEGRAAVGRLAAAGVDFIKVYSLLPDAVHRAVVEEAHRRGLKAVGHVPAEVTLEEAIRRGQDSSEHLTGLDGTVARCAGVEAPPTNPLAAIRHWRHYPDRKPEAWQEFLGLASGSSMVFCPTLVVMDRFARLGDGTLAETRGLDLLPGSLKKTWAERQPWPGLKEVWPHLAAAVKDLDGAGVTLLCGSDLGNPYVVPGASLHDEMELLSRAGLPNDHILRAAITAPAKHLGLEERLGAIERGRRASLVLLRANPLDDISAVRELEGVFHQGRHHDRAALDAMLDEFRAAARSVDSAAAAVPLEVPGTVLHRGRYETRVGEQIMATEEFVISEDQAGTHLAARVSSTGMPGVVTRIDRDPKGVFVSATWQQQSESPSPVDYSLTDGQLRAQPQDAHKVQTMPCPENALLSGPAHGFWFRLLDPVALPVGETVERPLLGFGFPSWNWTEAKLSITRVASEPASGTTPSHARYRYTMETGLGVFSGELRFEESGLLLEARVQMPFGVAVTRLKKSSPR